MNITRRNFLQAVGATSALGILSGCGGGGGAAGAGDTPMVVGYSNFSSKFSPFFAETAYDQDAQNLTQIALYPTTRLGEVVYKGIEGETYEYNGTDYTYTGPADIEVTENADGTVDYDITLRDDLKFSDGEPLTIDDYIFSLYVVCDPTYDGSATLFSMPIEGMNEYRSGMDTLMNMLIAAGEDVIIVERSITGGKDIFGKKAKDELRALAVNRASKSRWVEYNGKTVEIPAESAMVLA
jgi:peptide/nickel transport system substrate-binding protein